MWVYGALTAGFAFFLVTDEFNIGWALVTLFLATNLVLWFWLGRSVATDLEVVGYRLVMSSAGASHSFDLRRNPVVAVRQARMTRRLLFADDTSIAISNTSDDWARFVSMLERVQGTTIDQSNAGKIRPHRSLFGSGGGGYFEAST